MSLNQSCSENGRPQNFLQPKLIHLFDKELHTNLGVLFMASSRLSHKVTWGGDFKTKAAQFTLLKKTKPALSFFTFAEISGSANNSVLWFFLAVAKSHTKSMWTWWLCTFSPNHLTQTTLNQPSYPEWNECIGCHSIIQPNSIQPTISSHDLHLWNCLVTLSVNPATSQISA